MTTNEFASFYWLIANSVLHLLFLKLCSLYEICNVSDVLVTLLLSFLFVITTYSLTFTNKWQVCKRKTISIIVCNFFMLFYIDKE